MSCVYWIQILGLVFLHGRGCRKDGENKNNSHIFFLKKEIANHDIQKNQFKLKWKIKAR